MTTLDKVLSTVENGLAAAAFALITVVAFINVVSRYFLNASLAFTTEITVNVAVWMTLIGAAIGVREGAHLGFSLLHDRMRGRGRQVLTVLIGVAMVAFFAILGWYGWDQTSSQLSSGRTTPAMQIPQWLFSLALPVGSALGIVRTVHVTVRDLRGPDPADPGAPAGDQTVGGNGRTDGTLETEAPA